MPPRNAADFLELAKNCTFLDRKLISALYKTADGHELMIPAVSDQPKCRILISTENGCEDPAPFDI
jgi:hypothetical protein